VKGEWKLASVEHETKLKRNSLNHHLEVSEVVSVKNKRGMLVKV
jgi:hypothetical protein